MKDNKQDLSGVVEVKKSSNGNNYKKTSKNTFVKPSKLIQVARSKKQLQMIRETIRALLIDPRASYASKLLNISVQALYHRKKQYPEIIQAIEKAKVDYIKDVTSRIVFNADNNATNTMNLADNAKSEDVRLRANLELLAIAGIKKQEGSTNVQVNITNELNKDKEDFDL